MIVAAGITADGTKRVLGLRQGATENAAVCVALLEDLQGRGLDTSRPALLVLDGAKALHAAAKRVWGPNGVIQRCQVHKMRNILAKLPRAMQGQMKRLVHQVFRASSHAQALKRGRALIAQFRDRYPAAMECLERDLEECVTYLRFPSVHHIRIRTTNRLERLNGEGRRRTKVIPRFPTERSCLSLLFASLVTASKRWRGVKITPAAIKQLQLLRAETTSTSSQKAVA